MSDMTFSVVLSAVTAAFNKAVQGARDQYKQFTDTVGKGSDEAQQHSEGAGKAIYNLLNLKTGGALRTEIANLTSSLAAFKANSNAPAQEVERVTKAATGRIQELKNELNGVAKPSDNALQSIMSLGKGALALAGLTAGFGAVKMGIEAVVAATIKFDQITKQLEFATGSTEAAAREFDFAKQVAKDLGLELTSTAGSYAKLTAATKGTALEGQGTRDVFLGVASAAASLGLSADDTSGVLLALSQMASKGKVSMEELRGQLGERLPGAMAIAARSLGVTEQELNKLIDDGIDATTFLKAFGPAMIQAFAPTAAGNAKMLQGTINNLRNEFNLFLNDLGRNGIGAGLSAVIADISAAIGSMRSAIQTLDPATVKALEEAFHGVYQIVTSVFGTLMTAITEAGNALNSAGEMVTGLSRSFTGLDEPVEKVSFLTRTLQGLSITFGILRDGVAAIGILFQIATGDVQALFSAIAFGLSKVTFGDLSRQLEDLSRTMRNEAGESFRRAGAAVLNFRSAAVAALDATTEAAKATGAGVGAGVGSGASTAASALNKVGAAGTQAMGNVTSAVQQTNIALQTASGATVEVTQGLSTVGTEVADAFRSVAKEVGVNIPPSVKSVDDLGAALAAVAARTTKVASDIGKVLPEALGKLTGPELAQFQDSFLKGLDRAGASADAIAKALVDLSAVGAKTLGVDLATALTATSQKFQENRVTLAGFVRDFDALKNNGVNATKLVEDSLEAMLAKARNPVEIKEIIGLWQQLGREGKVSAEAMAEGLVKANEKLDAMMPGINSLAEAFHLFGLKSREEATLTATKYKEAYDFIKASGKATADELATAFTAYAQAAISANGGVVTAELRAEAAARGLAITVDATGKVIIKAMEEAGKATHGARDAFKDVEAQVRANADAMDILMTKYKLSSDYTEHQIELLEKEAALHEHLAEMERKRLNIDKQGFSLDKAGNTVNAGANTWMSILNQLKGMGVDDTSAARIAREFTDAQGNVQYFNNPGQLKYGERNQFGGTYDTIDMAIQRAATQYLQQQSNPAVGGRPEPDQGAKSADTSQTQELLSKMEMQTKLAEQQAAEATAALNANKTAAPPQQTATQQVVIEFKAPGGSSATVATTGSSTVEDVVSVLKSAGAVASVR